MRNRCSRPALLLLAPGRPARAAPGGLVAADLSGGLDSTPLCFHTETRISTTRTPGGHP